MCAIIYLADKLIADKSWYVLGVILLIMTVPREIFAQTYGWKAGFFNYVASMWYVLYILLLAKKNVFDNYSYSSNRFFIVVMFFVSLTSQWYSEPVTILNVVTIVSIISKILHEKKKIPYMWWSILGGTILGAGLMFINKGYYRSFTGQDSYRSVGGGIRRFYYNFRDICFEAFINNKVLMISLSMVLIIILLKQWYKFSKKEHFYAGVSMLFMVGFTAYNYFMTTITEKIPYTNILATISTCFFVLGIFLAFLIGTNKDIINIYLFLASILLLVPYIFIQPFGPRSVYGSTLLLSILTMRLVAEYLKDIEWVPILTITTVIMLAYYLAVGLYIHQGVQKNIDFLRYQQEIEPENKVLYYLEMPNAGYYWDPEHNIQENSPRFQRYCELPKEKGILIKKEDLANKFKGNSFEEILKILENEN